MKKIRKFAFLTIIAVFMLSSGIPLRADDTVLFTASVSPDALIALDLSGSMGSNPGGDYNYQSSYIGDSEDYCTDEFTYPTYDSSHPYRCNSDGYIWATSTCEGPFYTWRGGTHSTDCSKLAIAKRAIFDLLDHNDDGTLNKADEDSLNVRIGYMRFVACRQEDTAVDYDTQCNTLRRGFGFDYSKLWTDNIRDETNANRTPLVSQLKEGKKYLDDHKAGDTAAECRKKFIVLVTDGWDTLACGGTYDPEEVTRSFGYKRRKATVAAVKDVVAEGYQVFVVGFGADMPETERNTLNWVALKGGTFDPSATQSGDTGAITFSSNPCEEYAGCSPNQRECTDAPNDPGYKPLNGYAFMAQDAAALPKALQKIFKYVREKALTFTAPTVPSVRLMDTEYAYISSLAPNTTPSWRGDLKAYALEDDGTLDVTGDGFPSKDPAWEAQSKLATTNPNARTIYTYKSGVGRQEFTEENTNITTGDLNVSTATERQELIRHVRGFDPWDTDQDGSTTDTRDYKLGDIFHSYSVIVGAPSKFFVDQGYSGTGGFYDSNKNRTKVIYVGANDGMLHAFDAATGMEKWGFIPPGVLTSLKTMKARWDTYKVTGSAGEHLYYVDGSPRVSDVWFYSSATDTTKEAAEWKTVLMCGLRKGGKTYFALDVTNPSDPVFLWEFPRSTDTTTLNKMGQSWSDPAIAKIRIEVSGTLVERWVAFIGGGYMPNEDASEGRYVFVVDIQTGNILREFSGFSAPIAAPVTAVDTNNDGYVDRFYVGDEEGRLFAGYVGDKDPSNWTNAQLVQAPGAESGKHPFHYPAVVAFDDKGTVWVFAGTGPREDPRSNTKERFYAVKDNGLGPYPRGIGDLVDATTNPGTFTPVPNDKYGWTIKFADKEKVFGKAAVFNRLVYFTTYSPNEADPDVCTTGGTARLYVAEYVSGGGALAVDDLGDLEGGTTERSKVIGSGVPSTPVITIDTKGQAAVIIGTTENQVYSQAGFSPDTTKHVLYWREIFD